MKETFETQSSIVPSASPLVQVQNLSMRFRMPAEKVDNVKEFVIKFLTRKLRYRDFWVLKNISFRVDRGESVGILGRNGAGKSTLLKLISGIIEPTQGTITVQGNVVPLLKLGAGFDPDATGEENVYLNGAMLGYGKREMKERYDRIVEFAELGDFMKLPLKNYSSGMVARLGFAIAVDVDPDLLIVDEVLAVGDAAFQQKCSEKISSLQKNGTTLLLVSHSAAQVKALCKRALWIKEGEIVMYDDAKTVSDAYAADCTIKQKEKSV